MTGANRLRVGLAGLGRFGKLHAAVLAAMPDVSIAAVSDPRRDETAAIASTIPGIKTFDDFGTMLDTSELDAVFIVTPEPLHAAQALAAIERRIPVFLEKPLALTAAEGARVASAAATAAVPLQIGFVLRFDVQHALLKSRIAAGELGPIVSLRAKRNVSKAWFPDYGDRAHPMHETAIHDLDLLLWFAASPVIRVHAIARNRSGMRYPDGCWALLEFASGAVGIVETSWFVPAGAPANVLTSDWRGTIDAEIEVIGEVGSGRIRLLDTPISLWSAGFTAAPETGLWPETGGTIGGALREEVAHFLARVRHRLPETTASVADAVHGLRVVEAIVASTETGMPVDVESHGV